MTSTLAQRPWRLPWFGLALWLLIVSMESGAAATADADSGLKSDAASPVRKSTGSGPRVAFFPIGDKTTQEDNRAQIPVTLQLFNVNSSDPSIQVTLRGTSSNTNLVRNEDIQTFGGSPTNWVVFVTPATNQSGRVEITLTASAGGPIATTPFLLNVTSVLDPPIVRFVTPDPGKTNVFEAGATIQFEVEAEGVDGRVASLSLFRRSSSRPADDFLRSVSGDRLSYTLSNVTQDRYSFIAVATDENGLTATTEPLIVQVVENQVQTPTNTRIREGVEAILLVYNPKPFNNRVNRLNYTTRDSTAIAFRDYTFTEGQLVWTTAETNLIRIIRIQTFQNSINEPERRFSVIFTNPDEPAAKPPDFVVVIEDDDPLPVLTISERNLPPVVENSRGTNAVIALNLSSPSGQPISVEFNSVAGTAVSGRDYVPLVGLDDYVIFPAFQTQLLVTNKVKVIDNALDGPTNKTFFIDLRVDSALASLASNSNRITVTIVDDELPPALSITNAPPVREGVSGTTTNAVFPVTLSPGSELPVSVRYSTVNGQAFAGFDYQGVTNGIVTFAPGQTSTNLSIAVVGDAFAEPANETFFVDLSNPVNASILPGRQRGIGTILADPSPTISIADAAPVLEGRAGSSTNIVLTVSLSQASTLPISVRLSTSNGTGAAGSDFRGITNLLVTINAGQTSAPVTVTILGDALSETNETFFVELSNQSGNVVLGRSRAQIQIIDDDPVPAISIARRDVVEGNSGTTTATFGVSLSAPSGQTVRVSYATDDDTATAGSDYQSRSDSVFFPPGVTNASIFVSVIGDLAPEPLESFWVRLSNPVNATLAVDTAQGIILDDDAFPVISINDVSVFEGTGGTASAIFTVSLSFPSGQVVKVNYATTNGVAEAGRDYAERHGTLTFAPGVQTETIEVPVTGDAIKEFPETFLVTLSGPENATVAEKNQGIATIIDDDLVPAVSIRGAEVAEGNLGLTNLEFVVALSAPVDYDVLVNYATADGTAVRGLDYVASTRTEPIPAGATNITIRVPVVGDTLHEGDETLQVRLTGVGANATIAVSSGQGLILNDDPAPTLSINDVEVTEGNSGQTNVVFTVSLSAPSAEFATVGYETANDAATASDDFVARSGVVTFQPGETQKPVVVTVRGDRFPETDETFFVNLSTPNGAQPGKMQGLGLIVNDDPLPEISVADLQIQEGDTSFTTASFTVSLSTPSGQVVTVAYATASVTATTGFDFEATSGKLTFEPGQTSQTVSVRVNGDIQPEADEDLILLLSDAVNAVLVKNSGHATIVDDDAAPALSVDDVTVTEGSSGSTQVLFPVRLTRPSNLPVSVDFATADDTALAGADYFGNSGTLTFNPGEVVKTITVIIHGDTFGEADEAFFVALTNVSNASIGRGRSRATIVNDDAVAELSISDAAVLEGSAGVFDAVFNVSLSAPSGQVVRVDFATANDTATAAVDYESINGTLIFNPGEIAKSIAVPIRGDTFYETNETFFVQLSNLTNAAPGKLQAAGVILNDDFIPTLSILDAAVLEGDSGTTNAVFSVVLSGSSGLRVSVSVATVDGTAVAVSDYAPAAGTVTFNPGETNKTLNVAVLGDALDEAGEVFYVRLSNPVNAGVLNAQATGTIIDNDPPPVLSITDTTVGEGNVGAVNAAFTVRLSAISAQTVRVGFATTNGTAVAGADYVANTGTVTFAPGETSQLITVQIIGDIQNEAEETFGIALTNPRNTTLIRDQAIGTIIDNDASPPLAIADATITEGDGGSANVIFLVSLTAPSGRIVTVDYATANDTAVAGTDYLPTTGTLTFPPGETVQSIPVLILGDLASEETETFWVDLAPGQNANLSRSRGKGIIFDNDPLPRISIGDAEITEGHTGSAGAVFQITLSAASLQPVSFDYATVAGTATPGADFVHVAASLVFKPGETNKSIAVQVNGDTSSEGTEDFFVRLAKAVNAGLFREQGRGVIRDDDAVPSLSIADAVVTEADTGWTNAALAVRLSAPSQQTVMVDFVAVDDTATGSADYLPSTGTLVFQPGETVKSITVPVDGDDVYEGDEALQIVLSNPRNATLAKSQARLAVNDRSLPPIISIRDVAVTEGNAGEVRADFRVTLSAASALPVTVDFAAAGGTADADVDFQPARGTLNFSPGETSKTVSIVVFGDLLSESNEAFFVHLTNPTQATPGQMQATGLILDDDPAIGISISDAGVSEGDELTTNANFVVSLSAPSLVQVFVGFATAGGTAAGGTDFQSSFGTLQFEPGETNKIVAVIVRGDTAIEPDETFVVNLSRPVNATLADSQGLGTIANDDDAVAISISDAAVTEGASGTTLTVFTVSLSEASSQTVTVDFSTADDTALGSSDYFSAAGTVTFLPGATTQNIAVAVQGDTTDEEDERFLVNLRLPSGGVILDGQGIGSITDDDSPPRIFVNDVSVEERGTALFTVRLDAAGSRPVTIRYATTNVTATSADYTAASGTVTFAPGITSQTVSVITLDDTLAEPNETFALTLSSPANAVLADSQGLGTIVDNDVLPALFIQDAVVTEGNAGATNAVFSVTLSVPSAQTVSVNFTTAAGTARASEDFAESFGTLLFSPGVTNRSIVVAVNGDRITEAVESFAVMLSNPVNASLGSSRAAGTILDDDVEPTLTIADTAVSEGTGGSTRAVFTVRLSTAADQAVTVNYSTVDGAAVAGRDYVANTGLLTFAPGVVTNAVSIEIITDGLDEPNETFTVRLNNPRNARLADDLGLGTILDDDVTPTLTITDAAVTEGDSGVVAAVLTVRLSAVSGQPVTVEFQTRDGSASTGSDYSPASGLLTFQPGVVTQTVSVPVLGDTLVEGDETFVVVLANAVNAQIVDAQGQGAILNDDRAVNQPPIVRISNPANGAAFTSPAEITITVEAQDREGSVQRVDFFIGTTLLGSRTQSPYSFNWSNEASGAYVLTAVAVDDEGASATSSPVQILVSRNPISAKVAIVRNFAHPEITQMQNLLLDLRSSSQVFEQEGLTFDAISDARLIIWNDLGSSDQGLTDNDVRVFQQARDKGISLYFIGETLAASARNLSAAAQAQWFNLIHLRPVTNQRGDGDIMVDAIVDHPTTRGRFGVAGDFTYALRSDGVVQTAPGVTVLARSGGTDMLVAFEDDEFDSSFRSVTQDFLVFNGPEAHDRTEQRKIFRNSVAWLLRESFQALTDLSVVIEGPEGAVQTGQTLTYTATIGQRGEIPATGVELAIPLPAGVKLISASFIQGALGETNEIVTYHLGSLESGQQTTFTFALMPTIGGAITIAGNVSGNEADPVAANNTYALEVDVFGGSPSRPLLSLQRLANQSLQLRLTGETARTYRIQSSTNLVNWLDLTTASGPSSVVTVPEPAGANLGRRFFRAVWP